MTHEEAEGLRELADWIDANPENAELLNLGSTTLYVFTYSRDAFTSATRALGGKREKTADDMYFNVERKFGPITLQVTVNRTQVCEKVVTTREVVEHVPDPAVIAEAPTVAITRTVEDIEWVCDDSIFAGAVKS